jgi:hypothetical protein
MRTAPFLLTAVLASAPPGFALGADASAASGSTHPALAGANQPSSIPAAPWSLSLEVSGLAVDEGAVRSAVARELARAGVAAGTDPVQVAVSVAEGGNLQVRYRSPAGAELSRSVAAPARADEVPEASALLVGNLARDEAGALLAQLGEQSQAAASPPDTTSGVVPARAPARPADTAREAPPSLPLDSMNLSLAYPLTLRGRTEHRHFALELGMFYSRSGAVSGLSLTALGISRVDGPAYGAQIGGIGYWHGGPGAGVRLGTLFGASAGAFDGLSATAFATVHRGKLTGAELAAFTSIATGPLTGVQASGFFDYAGSVTGVQAAGFASVSQGPIEGVQAAGFANFARGVRGVQLSVLNIGGSVDGAQVGIVNIADDVRGTQIGVVNVAHSVKGQSIGFVPYNRQGGLKIATWYDSTQPFNMGVRFHAGALYMMPTFAFDPGSAALLNDPSRFRYAIGTSIGLRVPIDRAFIDLDANESQRSSGWQYSLSESAIDLRYRLLGGYRIMPGFALFAGGGLRHHFPDGGPRGGTVEPELSAGMEML